MSDEKEKFIKRFQNDIVGDVNRTMSTSRWLLENGLIDETIQENLVAYGYLASEDTIDFEVTFDIQKKMIYYHFFLDAKGLKRYQKYMDLVRKNPKSIIGKWLKLRRLRKVVPNGGHKISIETNIRKFLEAFLPDFNVTITIHDIDEFEETSAFTEQENEENNNKNQVQAGSENAVESDGVVGLERDGDSDGSGE